MAQKIEQAQVQSPEFKSRIVKEKKESHIFMRKQAVFTQYKTFNTLLSY
jgi:hypothetical protein